MNKSKNEYKLVGKIFVSKILYDFVNNELLKKTKIKPKRFWAGLDRSLYQLKEKNEKILQTRRELQETIDQLETDYGEAKKALEQQSVNKTTKSKPINK